MEYRIEKDAIGEKKVPKSAYYGIHTLRAKNNFEVINDKIEKPMIRALVLIKKSAAETNYAINMLDEVTKNAITSACDEILAGKYHNQFLTTCLQGGNGYSMIMNANEVIANRANEILGGTLGVYDLCSLEEVNLNQSVEDTMPTAIKIAAINLSRSLIVELKKLSKAYLNKAKRSNSEVSQSFIRISSAINRDVDRVLNAMNTLRTINVGCATKTVDGFNNDYIKEMVYLLTKNSHIQFVSANDVCDITYNLDCFINLSSILKTCALNISKSCAELNFFNDKEFLSLAKYEVENKPFILETIEQATLQIMGNDLVISLATNNNFSKENIYQPLIMFKLFNSLSLLKNSANILRKKVITNLTIN